MTVTVTCPVTTALARHSFQIPPSTPTVQQLNSKDAGLFTACFDQAHVYETTPFITNTKRSKLKKIQIIAEKKQAAFASYYRTY